MGFIGPDSFVVVNMMKIKLAILTFIISIGAIAADTTLKNLKLMQLYIDKNQLEKVEDLYDENEETLSKNWMSLERLAISFERREKFKEAIEIYRKIIINFNKEAHEKILSTSASKIDASYYDKNKLQLYYYKMAFLNTQLFSKTTAYSPENERDKYKKNAEGFIGLARKVKVDDGDLKLLEDLLQEKINKDVKLFYKASYYGSVDFISWQDRLYLVNLSSGVKSNLLSTAIGSCVGGGKKWENINYEFNVEGCFAVLTATISSEDRAIKYQQSSIGVKGFIIGPGMYFKTFSENVLLGVDIPLKYRQGDWTNPDKTQYRFEREKSYELGYFLQSKIKIKKFSLRTRLGKVFPNPGSLWSVGLLYDF
jgi:tetratricopeptide (TPR) repeat protein